jgi:RimK family alpha-L-glutamate ligase
MKRVWYFTPVIGSHEMKRFQEEAKKMKLVFKVVQYKDISLEFDRKNEFKYLGEKMDFKKGDIAVLRNPKFHDSNDQVFFNLLVNHLKSVGVKASNSETFINLSGARDKVFQYYILGQAGFPIIRPTYFMGSNFMLAKKLESINSLFIVKPRDGSRGVGIFRVENKEDFFNRAKDYLGRDVILQKFVSNRFDLRVICSQKKIFGVMKRIAKEGSIVNNFSAGGSVENYENLDKNIKKDCLDICKLFQCDYIGIDLILDGKKYHILEVNFFCHFKGFEKSTGTSFPKEVLSLLIDNK